jgi:hypothetical protein
LKNLDMTARLDDADVVTFDGVTIVGNNVDERNAIINKLQAGKDERDALDLQREGQAKIKMDGLRDLLDSSNKLLERLGIE